MAMAVAVVEGEHKDVGRRGKGWRRIKGNLPTEQLLVKCVSSTRQLKLETCTGSAPGGHRTRAGKWGLCLAYFPRGFWSTHICLPQVLVEVNFLSLQSGILCNTIVMLR